jgi:hypothetical protein
MKQTQIFSLKSNETWQAVCKENNTNIFNSFMYTFVNNLKPVIQLNIKHEVLSTERATGLWNT